MGLLDDAVSKASSALDAASGGQATSSAKAKAEFAKGDNISANEDNQGGSAAPTPDGSGDPVAFDFGIPIEFIHFGLAHSDAGKKFAHKSFNPDGASSAPEGHGIMFRDALLREAILMFGFISSTKQALQDATGSRGAIEEIGAAASNLLGGGSGDSKPDPSQLDSFLSDIKTEAAKLNAAQIKYPDIHAAGKKFHEIRANYIEFCNKLDQHYLKPPKSDGIGALSDIAGNIPGVGKTIQVVQRIIFKMFDLYLAAFLELRKSHERNIELSVDKLTLAAINGNYSDHVMIYPLWFKKPDSSAASSSGGGGNNLLSPVTDAVDDAKKEVKKVTDEIYDFAGANGTPEPTPGTSAISDIFSALKAAATDTSKNQPLGAADAISKGLDATLSDIGGVPKFMKRVIQELTNANLGLLEDVFGRLMANGANAPINSALLLEGGRHYLTQTITKLFTKLILGMITGGQMEDLTLGVPGGKSLSAQQTMAKQLDDKLGKYVEPVIQFMIGDLAGQLEASRKKAADQKALTMEVLLGRLPWLTAVMFKNTFFPMWNLVAEEVFGQVAPPLKSALQEYNSVLNKAKDQVDKAAEYKRRGEKVKDDASNVSVGLGDQSDLQKIRDDATQETDEGKKRREERAAAEDQKNALDKFYKDNDKDKEFPVSSRVVDGEAIKVEEEIESVLPVYA